ncbi:hypothetical protein KR018_000929 [Drosophila ironensis]|nr:hypothetical protein KR018_000929 [Drosophila ironensis]
MTGSLLRFLWPLALLQCIPARVPLIPRFYGQEGGILTIETDMKLPPKLDSKLQNALYYNLPVYKVIRPKTTTTTTTPPPSQYPSDLLDLAHNKLGLKELPSLEELGELIGTNTPAETISYIRTLTSDAAGIALMKQYLDTLNFEDENVAEEKDDAEDDDNDDDNTMDNVSYDDLPREKPSSSTVRPSPENSLIQRFGAFMKQYNLWSSETTTPAPAPTPAVIRQPPPVAFKPVFLAPPKGAVRPMNRLPPMLVRQPLPYHYPIPLRPVMLPAVQPTHVPSTTAAPKPHLNTPKLQAVDESADALVAPHIRQLAKLTNISPQVLDSFLQQQPKLAELAKRVSTLALSPEQTQAMDSQVFMAIQRALSQNEELKRLIEAAQTLK